MDGIPRVDGEDGRQVSREKSMQRVFVGALVSLFLVLALASAQTTSTSILGTVTDPSGAVVVGAKVTALKVRTSLRREDVTSGTGDYSLPFSTLASTR